MLRAWACEENDWSSLIHTPQLSNVVAPSASSVFVLLKAHRVPRVCLRPFDALPVSHFGFKIKGQEPFPTQCYINGYRQNADDGVLNSIRDERARQSVQVDFMPIKDSKIGELAAKFDVVLGFTPKA